MKPGDFLSVWKRDSRRHKWRLEYSIVRLLRLDGPDVLVQLSGTTLTTGPTSFSLRGVGTWERKLEPAVLLPVQKDG